MLPLCNALTLAALVLGQGASPHYTLNVRVEPEVHRLVVRGSLENWSCAEGKLYLHRAFHIDRLRVGGRDVAAVIDTAASPPMWVPVARPIGLQCGDGAAGASALVEFEYSGAIADTISGVNMVTPRLVELALYSGWFPRDPTRSFTYDLTLDLPAGWVVAAGGRTEPVRSARGRQIVRIVSTVPGGDIAFVAAPDLVVQHVSAAGASVEVVTTQADRDLARAGKDGVARALALLRRWFGEPSVTGAAEGSALRFVYSPRDGWGYSRLPLVIVSSSFARGRAGQPLGAAWNLLGNAHEIAHFWWRIANTNTTDDWINEGLAEFSAWSAVGEAFGAQARDSIAARYRADIVAARSDTPIALTPTDSPDRYVNRYEKAALVFGALEARVGAARLHSFLAQLHAGNSARGGLRTAEFVQAARAALGEEAGSALERCVLGPWRQCEAASVPGH